jgi:hypothetical protein
MRKAGLFIFALLIFGAAVGYASPRVSALGTRYFDDSPGAECDFWNRDASAPWCDRNKAVRIISGSSTSVTKTQDKFRAYYSLPSIKNPDGTNRLDANGNTIIDPTRFPNTLTLTITHADYCPSASVGNSIPAPGNGHAVDTLNNGYYETNRSALNNAGGLVTDFYVGKPGQLSHHRQGFYRASCTSDRVIQLSLGDFTATTHVAGLYYVEFEAALAARLAGSPQACFDNPNNATCAGVLNSFTLTQAGSTNAQYIANVGTASGADTGYATTIREEDENQDINGVGTNATFMVRFGADCTVGPAGSDTKVSFFDLDFNAGEQGQVRLEMKSIAPNGAVRWLDNNGNWLVSRNNAGYAPPSINGRFTNWNFHADHDYKYVLYIKNVNPILVQQFSTPYDGIYYHYDCADTPPAVVRPSLTLAPSDIEPGQLATARAALQNSSPSDASILSGSITMWQTNDVNSTSGARPTTCGTGAVNVPSGTTRSAGRSCTEPGAADYAYVCASYTGVPGPGTTLTPPTTRPVCINVSSRPFLSIYGGDAIAGKAPQEEPSSGQCSADNKDAGFVSWSQGGPGWVGAGAQYAVQALGTINDFASAQRSTAGAPTGLAFANNPASLINPSAGLFGGKFNSTDGVNCDYTSDITAADTVTGNLQVNGGGKLTISQGNPNRNMVIYVKGGNAFIDNDIVYANDNWVDVSRIPSFRLVVVGGDIIIDHRVTQLFGTYVAETDSRGNGGTIVTCAKNEVEVDPRTTATYYTDCNSQLTIYGSFVAQQVHFGRTSGSVGLATATDTPNYPTAQGTTHAAEVFVYSPAVWLANLKGINAGGDYSVTGLPPVL